MAARIELKGLQQVQRAIAQLGERAPQAMGRALFVEGEDIMGDSQANYVPVKDGHLRGSGHVVPPVIHAQSIVVEMGYGGPAIQYALVQHENMDFHHTVGGPKYLERPLLAAVAGMPQRLAARLKAERVAG